MQNHRRFCGRRSRRAGQGLLPGAARPRASGGRGARRRRAGGVAVPAVRRRTMKDVVLNPLTWVIRAALCGRVAAILTTNQQREQRLDLGGWVTGGDGYAALEPHKNPDGGVGYFLRHVGAYPLQDVNVKIYLV